MNPALDTVMDYIRMSDARFALLITGPWGCGKTYFWQQIVAPKLKSERLCKRTLYASLYGVESTRSIDTQLLIEPRSDARFRRIRECVSSIFSVVKEFGRNRVGFDVSGLDLRWLIRTQDTVVCFDDLERCKMPIEETLGYVNHFVEHCSNKVVVLCNEDKIPSESKGMYDAMREKVVGFSFTYKPDYNAVVSSLFSLYKDVPSFHAFLNDNRVVIHDLFLRSEADNIRALHKAITALKKIFDVLCEKDVEPRAVDKTLIYAVVPTALELYGRAAEADLMRAMHSSAYMGVGMAARAASLRREQDAPGSDDKGFVDRYLKDADWVHARGCQPVCEYLISGHLDVTALATQMKELSQDTPEKQRRRFLYDWAAMGDDEFQRAAALVIGEIKEGQVTQPGEILTLFTMYESLAQESLIPHTTEEVLSAFRAGVEKCVREERFQANSLLPGELDHFGPELKTEGAKILREEVLQANARALKLQHRARVGERAAQMMSDPEGFIKALIPGEESNLGFTPVFDALDPVKAATWIVDLPNGLKRLLGSVLHARYVRGPVEDFVDEVSSLEQIRDRLEARSQRTPDAGPLLISDFHIRQLVQTLDGVIQRLRGETGDKPTHSANTE